MGYKKKTNIFGIPYMGDGDTLQGSEEEKIAKMIDNILFAGTCGMPKALFEDGNYKTFDNGDDTVTVTVSPQATYSVLGILNYRLFMSESTFIFDKLSKGQFYYLYAGYTNGIDTDPKLFRRVATTVERYTNNYILLATLDLRNGGMVLDEEPEGKLYSKDILAHTGDTTNPHGRHLHQDILTVHDEMYIGDSRLHETVYVDALTTGATGTVLSVDENREIMFVNIMPKEQGIGEYWVVISGNTCTVYSSSNGKGFKAELRVK